MLKWYVSILQQTHIPSVQTLFGEEPYLFMLDNDPKHTSKCARNVLVEIGLSGGICTPPPESPDL